jgi:hypothetical protein
VTVLNASAFLRHTLFHRFFLTSMGVFLLEVASCEDQFVSPRIQTRPAPVFIHLARKILQG